MNQTIKPEYSKQFWEILYAKYQTKYKNDHTKAIPALISENKHLWKLGKISSLDGLREISKLIYTINNEHTIYGKTNNETAGLFYRFLYEYVDLTSSNKTILMNWYNGARDDILWEALACTEKLNTLCNETIALDSTCLSIFTNGHTYLYYKWLRQFFQSNDYVNTYQTNSFAQLLFKECFIEWITLEDLISQKPGMPLNLSGFISIRLFCEDTSMRYLLKNLNVMCPAAEDLEKFYLGWHSFSTSNKLKEYIEKNRDSMPEVPQFMEILKLVDSHICKATTNRYLTSNLAHELLNIDDFDLYKLKKSMIEHATIIPCEYPTLD